MHIGLTIGGTLVTFLGGVLTLGNRKQMRRRKRIIDTPTTTIASAPGNGIAEIKGRVLVGEAGTIQAPFSGRHGVHVCITVEEYRSHGRSGSYVTVLKEARSSPFYVDDGSGQIARVVPNGAEVMLDRQNVVSSGTFKDPPPHVLQFLAAHGINHTGLFGFNKSMRYEEEVLSPGDPIYALGPSRREPGPPAHDGYRDHPTTRLVLEAGAPPGADAELLLTNKTEEQLIARLRTGFVAGIVLLCVGALMLLASLAVR